MMIKPRDLDQLFVYTKKLLRQQREKLIIRGENFNVFSVLRFERLENRTHSAFIGELLNPNGAHLKGNTFLNLFLETIGNKEFISSDSKLVLEKYIGKIDEENKVGGRIDIFIEDKKGKSISIENKIDAKDQSNQILRYYNYKNRDGNISNKVYYLNLFGNPPTNESSGGLISEKDYFIISYKSHILEWLDKCFKESADNPILRETIKQYLILIKKITHQMNNSDDKELIDLIQRYYEEAVFVMDNIESARMKICEIFRQDLFKRLVAKLHEDFEIVEGDTATHIYSQIWVKYKDCPDSPLYFGIESFSGLGAHEKGNLFIGIFQEEENNYAKYSGINPFDIWWVKRELIGEFRGDMVNLSNNKMVAKIASDNLYKNDLLEFIEERISEFLNQESNNLKNYLTINYKSI